MAYNYINKSGLQYIWNKIKAKFVAKDGDKVLSDNNFTDALKTKLDGIATGANKTTVDTALSSTSTNPVQNKVINSALGGKLSTSGTAAAATKLATARTIQTNLGLATAASFDGTGNITPGITGTLTVAHGGTGATTAANARTNLGITPANIGALPSSGTAASATKLATGRTIRTNLGSTSTATFDGTTNVTPGVTGTLPIVNGGTGATTAANARSSLGITPANIGALATSGGTVTGETIFQKGMYVHSATGTSGSTGFVNIAQFSLSGTTYQNVPLELTVYRRGTTAPTYLFIEFSSANNADPGLASFKYSGYGDSTSFYMYKSATSTWQLYIKKTESYDNIGIGSYTTNFAYMNVAVTWKNVHASSAPSGSTAATYMSVGSASTATTATKLATARTIRTNLASTSTASFDGSANVTPGITGTLAVGHGGTGMTSNPSLQVNLASGSAASVFASSPRPGVTGILPISHGGTGVNSESALRNKFLAYENSDDLAAYCGLNSSGSSSAVSASSPISAENLKDIIPLLSSSISSSVNNYFYGESTTIPNTNSIDSVRFDTLTYNWPFNIINFEGTDFKNIEYNTTVNGAPYYSTGFTFKEHGIYKIDIDLLYGAAADLSRVKQFASSFNTSEYTIRIHWPLTEFYTNNISANRTLEVADITSDFNEKIASYFYSYPSDTNTKKSIERISFEVEINFDRPNFGLYSTPGPIPLTREVGSAVYSIYSTNFHISKIG